MQLQHLHGRAQSGVQWKRLLPTCCAQAQELKDEIERLVAGHEGDGVKDVRFVFQVRVMHSWAHGAEWQCLSTPRSVHAGLQLVRGVGLHGEHVQVQRCIACLQTLLMAHVRPHAACCTAHAGGRWHSSHWIQE